MKKIFKLFIVMLAVCGISCEQMGGILGGGNQGGDEPNSPNNPSDPGTTEAVFNITVTDITSSGAYVAVETTSNETYYFDVIEKEYLDQYTDKKVFAAEMVAELKAYYEEEGYTLADALSYGSDGYLYEEGDLEPNTDYYAFAVAVTENGVVNSDLTLKQFKTLEAAAGGSGSDEPSNNSFAITVSDITSSGATVAIVPSNTDTYYFDVIEKDVFDTYTDKQAFAAEMVAGIKEYCESYGYTLADALSSGSDTYTYEDFLDANTDYYAFAVGVSSSGVITTDITVKAFTTLASGNGGGNEGGKEFNNLSYGYYTNCGDYYESNATNWYIDLYPEEGMDFVTLEVQTALDATDFTGNYTLASTFEAGTAVAGFVEVDDEGGYVCGSYWGVLYSNYELADYALLASGSVTIGKTGSNYTIVVDAVDIDGYKVTVNYEGVLKEYIDDGASLLSVRKKPARRLRFVPKTKSENGALSYRAITKVAESKDSIIKRKLMK